MRLGGALEAAALAAVGLGAAPLGAQDNQGFTPAFSAEDDLDCAIYVGALMAEMDTQMSADDRTGLTSALTYFTGRYEAQRGLDIETAFAEHYPRYQTRDPAAIAQTCSARMRAFGARLESAGRALARIDPTAQPQDAPRPAESP
ncbi:hypothetical protein [Qipengyuania nanhaisediminis]|uniref:hypothetical protein n=1 Tax=Qipengyuania nanhaisediminis TaxID=604088 RepID=UPI0038B2455A